MRTGTPIAGLARIGILSLLATLCISCTSTANRPVEPEALSSAVVDLQFFDSSSFDSSLAEALDPRPMAVVVTPAASISINDIPERLDQWLYAVQDSGGSVKAVEEPQEVVRGGIPGGLGTIIEVSKYVIKKRRFGKARNYDVTLYHDRDGQITRASFERRQATP